MVGVCILAGTKGLVTAVITIVIVIVVRTVSIDLIASVITLVILGICICAGSKHLVAAVVAIMVGVCILAGTDGNVTAIFTYVVAVGICMIANLAAASIASMIGIGIGADQVVLSANVAEVIHRILIDAIMGCPRHGQSGQGIVLDIGKYVDAVHPLKLRTLGGGDRQKLAQCDRFVSDQHLLAVVNRKPCLAAKEDHVACFHGKLTCGYGDATAIHRQGILGINARAIGLYGQASATDDGQFTVHVDAILIVGTDQIFSDQVHGQIVFTVNTVVAVILLCKIGKAVQRQNAILKVCIAALGHFGGYVAAVIEVFTVRKCYTANGYGQFLNVFLHGSDDHLHCIAFIGIYHRIDVFFKLYQGSTLGCQDCKLVIDLKHSNDRSICLTIGSHGQERFLSAHLQQPDCKDSHCIRAGYRHVHGATLNRDIVTIDTVRIVTAQADGNSAVNNRKTCQSDSKSILSCCRYGQVGVTERKLVCRKSAFSAR